MHKSLFSRKSDNWSTPIDLFNLLNNEFHFNLDPCANFDNHLCDLYFDIYDNGLLQDWSGHNVFCNPPYSQIGKWVEKCYYESLKPDTIVVLLIPVRTDTKYFHNYIYNNCEIRFIKGRLRFSGSNQNAPFPSMLCIFGK